LTGVNGAIYKAGWLGLQIIEKTWTSYEPNEQVERKREREKGMRGRRESNRNKK
jgi:hypothetical protein